MLTYPENAEFARFGKMIFGSPGEQLHLLHAADATAAITD